MIQNSNLALHFHFKTDNNEKKILYLSVRHKVINVRYAVTITRQIRNYEEQNDVVRLKPELQLGNIVTVFEI